MEVTKHKKSEQWQKQGHNEKRGEKETGKYIRIILKNKVLSELARVTVDYIILKFIFKDLETELIQ